MNLIRKGESLYQYTLMLLDYDADGVIFNENSLEGYLYKESQNELSNLLEDEFKIVKKSFLLYWENLSILILRKLSKLDESSIFIGGYSDELEEIKKIIEWTELNFVFKEI